MQSMDAMMIGGTGIGDRLAALGLPAMLVPTEYGTARGFLLEENGRRAFVVQRHSAGHKTPPHLINYRAMADAARRLGVRACFATAAVGCLRPDWLPGTLVVCRDFIDMTDRSVTMWDRKVRHVDFSNPMAARNHMLEAGKSLGISVEDGGVYAGLDGPRYETFAEVEWVRRSGGELVGMTASTEAEVMVEAGVPYACMAVVTNLAAGMTDAVLDHNEVVDVMKVQGDAVVKILRHALTLV
jgi:5'-methylthioadenosine phosphorylase